MSNSIGTQPSNRASYESFKVADVQTVNVEELANCKARYYTVHAEEAEYFARDPTARNQTREQLRQQPLGSDRLHISPDDVVRHYGGLEPDEVLQKIEEKMNSTPRSNTQHMHRLIAAVNGLCVFNKFKIDLPLEGHLDLIHRIDVLAWKQLAAWLAERRKHPLLGGTQQLPTPPSSRNPSANWKRIIPKDIDDIIDSPLNYLNAKFMYITQDNSDASPWVLQAVEKDDEGAFVYTVKLEDGLDVSHTVSELRELLAESDRVVN